MHRIAPCAPYLPRRASDTNKYDYGRVLIVGGCVGYTGAPTLCARAALRCGACDTVVGSTDTIVVSDDGRLIAEIPERGRMYQGQTPQSFRISLLKKLYTSLSDDEKAVLTDACKICVVRNTPVELVQGEVSNLKITTVSDYKIAQAMVGGIAID